jgi:ABC-2 type transport system ATP-binding protein
MADRVGIIDRGKLVREGTLADLLGTSGEIRVRVGDDQVARAAEVLTRMFDGADVVTEGLGHGWLSVRANPDRAAEVNRALVTADVEVSRLESGSDLERIFLSLTEHRP